MIYTSCEGEKKDYIPDTIGDVYFVTTTFRNKKLSPTMFHFELDSEGDILKFSSNSIASPEGWGKTLKFPKCQLRALASDWRLGDGGVV